MSRLSKILFSTLLLTLFFLMACGGNIPNPAPSNSPSNKDEASPQAKPVLVYTPMGKTVYSPVDIEYVIDNPLEIIEVKESQPEDFDHQRSYFQIKGLADKSVEDQINQAIKELYEEMVPYGTGEKRPPYRGIEAAFRDAGKIYNSTISVSPHFNANNVLSAVAYVWVACQHPTYGHVYFSANEALNFDLSTGKEFKIADVFTNNAQGLEIINEAIAKEIDRRSINSNMAYDDFGTFSLVAPFKGINHDQKFFVSTNGLNIIIDYNNPEFDLGFMHNLVTLSYYSPLGQIAITERFYDEATSIFVYKPTSKRFLQDFEQNRHHERINFKDSNIDWNIAIGYPQKLSQKFTQIIDSLRVDKKELSEFYEGEEPLNYIEQNIYAYRMGPYVNIISHFYISGKNVNQWQEYNYVYDQDGNLLTLEDLFIDGYDYGPIITNKMEYVFLEYGLSPNDDLSVFLEGLIFKLDEVSVSFVIKNYEWRPGEIYPLHFHMLYEELGYDNLKIFKR